MKKNSALYRLRKKAGLSQRELADLCNTSSVQICNLENGNRTINENWLERLSVALNCTKAELLGEEPAEQLSAREKAFLEMFRNLSEREQDGIMAAFNVFAQPEVKKEAK